MSTNQLFWTKRVALILLLGAVATPAVAQTTADQPVTVNRDDDGFDDWGLLGLLGLGGLLGRRRTRDTIDARRT